MTIRRMEHVSVGILRTPDGPEGIIVELVGQLS